MVFHPDINQELLIDGASFRIAEHPSAPGMPYGQEGRTAVVYQLLGANGKRALKVFKPRFRVPGLVSLARRLEPFGDLSGLSVCHRTVLTPQRDNSVLSDHPDLIYAVIMPWIEGPTWMEVLLNRQLLTPEQSLSIARSVSGVLGSMEQESLAHCDLSGPNVLLPVLAATVADQSQAPVELVDVEQMYSPGLRTPDYLPAGSSGYAHNTAHEGMWSSDADRFAGALLLAEMLGWCDERVQNAAWGESYFDPEEMQKESDRYRLLVAVLRGRWGAGVSGAFEQTWLSGAPVECPTFGEWMMLLPPEVESGASVVVQPQAGRSGQIAPAQPTQPDVASGNSADGDKIAATGGEGENAQASARARELIDEAVQLESAGDRVKALDTYRRARSEAPPGSALAHELDVIIANVEQKQQTERLQAQAKPAPQPAPPTGGSAAPPGTAGAAGTGAPPQLERLFDDGLAAYRRGDWLAARALLSRVVQQDPRYTRNGQYAATLLAEVERRLAPQPSGAFVQPQPPAQPQPQPQARPYSQPPAQPYGQAAPSYQQYPPQQPGYTYVQPSYPPPGLPPQTGAPAKKGSALPIILLVLGLLVFACVGGTYLVITSTVGAISTGIGSLAASVAATETAEADDLAAGGHADPQATPVEQLLKLDKPRAFKYADLDFTVAEGLITNRLPGDTPRYRSDAANLTLTLDVVNKTSEFVGVTSARFDLELGDGSVYQASLDEALDAQNSDSIQMSFEVPLTSTWDGAQLTLKEADKEPATIPLTGSTADALYPSPLRANGQASIKEPQLTFKIEGASVDLDAFGQRAQVGKRYLLLKVLVSSQEPKYDAYVGPESFRVIIDGKPVGPEQLSPAAEAVKAATEQGFTMAFAIPSTAGNAELQVGEVGKETARIPLGLQAAKP